MSAQPGGLAVPSLLPHYQALTHCAPVTAGAEPQAHIFHSTSPSPPCPLLISPISLSLQELQLPNYSAAWEPTSTDSSHTYALQSPPPDFKLE